MSDLKARLDLISEAEFAALRGVKVSALWNERSRGKGPPFIRVGRRVYYTFAAIRAYIDAHTVKPARTPTLIDGRPDKRRRR
jgi:predicted DNA-binding transcriptional regulator AlpA